jgi:hypothetical protein
VDTTYAYLAGVIDSDGFITVQRTRKNRTAPNGHTWQPMYYTPKVGISGTRSEPHGVAVEAFGGTVTCHTPVNKAHRMVYLWSVSGPAAGAASRLLMPFLRIKGRQALLAIELAELVTAQYTTIKATQVPPYRVPDEMTLERERIWQAVTALNEPRNRRVHFAEASGH